MVLLIFNRQWRALMWFAIIGGGLGLASIAVAGWPLHFEFLQQMSNISGEIALTSAGYLVESLLLQLDQFIRGLPMVDGRVGRIYTFDEPLWIWLTTRLDFGLGLIWIYRATRQLADAPRLAVQLFTLSLLMALIGPFTGSRYYVLPLLMSSALYWVMPKFRATTWIVGVSLCENIIVFVQVFPLNQYFLVTTLLPVTRFAALFVATLRAASQSVPVMRPAAAG